MSPGHGLSSWASPAGYFAPPAASAPVPGPACPPGAPGLMGAVGVPLVPGPRAPPVSVPGFMNSPGPGPLPSFWVGFGLPPRTRHPITATTAKTTMMMTTITAGLTCDFTVRSSLHPGVEARHRCADTRTARWCTWPTVRFAVRLGVTSRSPRAGGGPSGGGSRAGPGRPTGPARWGSGTPGQPHQVADRRRGPTGKGVRRRPQHPQRPAGRREGPVCRPRRAGIECQRVVPGHQTPGSQSAERQWTSPARTSRAACAAHEQRFCAFVRAGPSAGCLGPGPGRTGWASGAPYFVIT